MSKKRLYKKNIKTKKKIKGGLDGIAAAAAAAADSTNKLGDELGGVVNKIDGVSDKLSNKVGDVDNALNAVGDNAIGALNAVGDNAIGALNAAGATAVGLSAVANNPFAKGALNAVDKLKKGIKFITGSLTPEDKYRQALMKLIKNPDFNNYFATAINKVIVLNFYNVLIELGKYSRNYSDISKEIFEITGENMFDEDDDLYSELNEESSHTEESSNKINGTQCDAGTDKILSDKNIENFLKNTITLCIPVIKQIFKSLGTIIENYKQLKGKMNGLLEKAERENNVEKYFDDFRILSDEATEQINAIFYEFDTSNMSGGSEIDNIEDDFFDALFITNRDNFSKLLKQKLHGILNKIIRRLYDIAKCKDVIDDDDDNDDYEYDMKFLEKKAETSEFNIEDFEKRILERIKNLEKEQGSLDEKQSDFDKKSEENYNMFKEKITLKKGGAKFFLPEALREKANAVSDSLSMVKSQKELQEENLEIIKIQNILIEIIKKMICKIQTKSDIDLDAFKNIVTPAFNEKKMQFRTFVKFWSKDLHEKQELLDKVLKNGNDSEVVTETKEYMKKIKTQIDIAIKNQKEIKEYIKTKEEKQNGGNPTRKFSSLISRKTLRHIQTSQ